MANSLPWVELDGSGWIDAYSESGIGIGLSLTIQNVGNIPITLIIDDTAPVGIVNRGNIIMPKQFLQVSSGELGCFLSSSGFGESMVSIQEGIE